MENYKSSLYIFFSLQKRKKDNIKNINETTINKNINIFFIFLPIILLKHKKKKKKRFII